MEKFDKFEKLDRQVEKTIIKVETMERSKFYKNSFVVALIWAIVLNLIIETLGRFTTTSILGGLGFMFTNPVVFFYNTLILFSMLVIASVFKRRLFVFSLISLFWLIIGIVNGVILTQRMTPFTVKDLGIIEDGITIATNYLKTGHIVLAVLGVIVLISGIILLYIKGPKKEDVHWKRNIVAVALVVATTFGTTSMLLSMNRIQSFFGNLAYAYRDYGVVYCFINTWLNTGIDKPKSYSEEYMKSIFNKDELGKNGVITDERQNNKSVKPNIIFLQLESFIDPYNVKYLKLNEDPIPYYRRLMKAYTSGELTVPACGAGTANVEFENLTGLSVKFFGPGEYPYKSILTEKTGESLAYNLRELGYTSHAIHNHRAVFYNRNLAFANMGFDTFTSVEYMNNVEKTPKNWAKDKVLTGCIKDALTSTKGRDMIYAISVQGHGKYPTEEIIKNAKIHVLEAPSQELKWKWEYYCNQIKEMDDFVKELIQELNKIQEPTILVMYGDHIPAIDVKESDLKNGNLYGTQYVIWDNMGLKRETEDMHSYQMAAYIMKRNDLKVGTVFTYQQNHRNSETYLEDLKAIGYDILYGKKYIYSENKDKYMPTKLKMGVKDIVINKVYKVGDRYYIKGKNFTQYSKVTLKGKTLNTIFLGQSILGLLEEVDPEDAPNMKVSQVENKSKEILSTTE